MPPYHQQAIPRAIQEDKLGNHLSQEVFQLEKAILICGHEKEAVMAPFKEVYKDTQKAT
jgi:hypothetical protein